MCVSVYVWVCGCVCESVCVSVCVCVCVSGVWRGNSPSLTLSTLGLH